MFKALRTLAAAAALALVFALTIAPAAATINPTITLVTYSPLAFAGTPGVGRIVFGTITFGPTDTYVTGGFTVTPTSLAGQVSIQDLVTDAPNAQLETSISFAGGNATVKLATQMQGSSNMTATATTKVVTVAGLTANDVLSANTPIFVSLDDAATGGGGTGTWSVTAAVASVKYTSPTTFTVTATAAAPTNGGNFTYFVPTASMEMAAGTPIAGYVIPFTAVVL